MMSDGLLKQEEIDALLNASETEPARVGAVMEDLPGGSQASEAPVTETGMVDDLKNEEKDALGEIGNICMGAAATTLSMLLNQKVNITSPQVTITALDDLLSGFTVPYMTIYIEYIEGLSGFNLLMIKLEDAAVLADLMMGGDGRNISEELTDIGISAAAEAMNQMIGSASTSMSSMFGRTVNISPPSTIVYRREDDSKSFQLNVDSPVVVASFKMTIGEILNTQIMQVMSIETAREEARFVIGNLYDDLDEAPDSQEPIVTDEITELADELADDLLSDLQEGVAEPDLPELVSSMGASGPKTRPQQVFTGTPVAPQGWDQKRLNLILDIPLKVTALLGRTRWPIKDILGIVPGSVVELENMVDEPLEILVNGILVAMGEVVVVNENFGVRITSIIGPEERLQKIMQKKIP